MATVIGTNQVKLNDGKVVQAKTGEWFDAQQFVNGTLSNPGQINPQSTQQGAGGYVSPEVMAQTNPANVQYVKQQQQKMGVQPTAAQPMPTATPTPSGDATGGMATPETINLPQIYEGLYSKSGIRDVEADLTNRTNAFNEQISKIKDNPYLSEATMTGRIKKLEERHLADTANIKNDIAMRKADIETQLNLQTKQFDINSQAARDALDKFQTLLTSGSLAGASGEDIANLTRTTGLSSSMIQSAIKANADKNVSTSTIQFDDGTNQGFVIINDKTGEVINKQVIGASKPKGASAAETKDAEAEANRDSLITSIKNGITLKSLISYYGRIFNTEEIAQLYNINSPFGAAKEDIEDIKAGKFSY